MFFKKISILLLVLSAFVYFHANAQKSQAAQVPNFSTIRVDDLTDDQVRDFIRQVESTGLTDAQLEQVAKARGMQPDEITKLRARVDKIKKADAAKQFKKAKPGKAVPKINADRNASDSTNDTTIDPETEAEKALMELKARIFGTSLFKNAQMSFEPSLNIVPSKDYVIGIDDEINIDVTGDNEATYSKIKVSKEGTIRIEYAGIIQVAGLTLEQADKRIESKLAAVYPAIRAGRTSVTVSVGILHSIKVTLLGEIVKPGTYTLPSLATVFNALYASGGPTENGSFRAIEIIRNNKVIATLDIYEFLLKGTQGNNIVLKDQDIIRVPTYRLRVQIAGEIKRPLLFELKEGETLADVINFAGGFTDRAYSTRIKVVQNTEKERSITDVMASSFDKYVPKRGDQYYVEPILDRYTNRVKIEGAVFRPGEFELTKGLTITSLLKKAEGLKEDAFLPRAYINRLRADNSTELLSFDLGKIIAGTSADIPLMREDVIMISSVFELREEYKVTIKGQVQSPGIYNYAETMNLEDLILQAGGFLEGASEKRIEVARRVKNSNVLSASANTAQIFLIDVSKDLKFSVDKFILEPFDIVFVRTAPDYGVQREVTISGEVLYPGKYTISRKNEKISDLIKRAGGLSPLAFPSGASLKRPNQVSKVASNDIPKDQTDKTNPQAAPTVKNSKDTTQGLATPKEEPKVIYEYVGIDMERILADSTSPSNLTLEAGDSVVVPKQLQTIKVSGEVLSPITIVYEHGKSFKEYVHEAGGFSNVSLRRRSYVVYANGKIRGTRKIFLFNSYPRVEPGAEIFIPKNTAKRNISVGEFVGIGSSIASLALLVITLTRL